MTLWNLYQEFQISNIRAQQRGAETTSASRHESVREQVWSLEDRFERLLIVTEAMWELCSERLGISEEELAARAAAIDRRDGSTDGRRTREHRRCASCEAAVPHARPNCLFCGEPVPGASSPLDHV